MLKLVFFTFISKIYSTTLIKKLIYFIIVHLTLIISEGPVIIVYTRRVPVQRDVERDEIPYPYKVHDTTLRPHNYKIDHSRA